MYICTKQRISCSWDSFAWLRARVERGWREGGGRRKRKGGTGTCGTMRDGWKEAGRQRETGAERKKRLRNLGRGAKGGNQYELLFV